MDSIRVYNLYPVANKHSTVVTFIKSKENKMLTLTQDKETKANKMLIITQDKEFTNTTPLHC